MNAKDFFDEQFNQPEGSPAPGAAPTPPPVVSPLATALGFSNRAADMMSIPRARLAQGLTPEVLEGVAQPGSWILPGGRITSEIVGRVVGLRKVRARWQRDEHSAFVVCRSDDGETGVGDPGGQCQACPLAQWVDGPPVCTLSYEYLIMMTDDQPVVLSFSTRSASATIGQLNLAIRARGQIDVVVRSQLVVKGSKRYYIPTVTFEWSK